MQLKGILLVCIFLGYASSLSPKPKIIGGFDVSITDYSYQLYMLTDIGSCGASVVGVNWAITAAHCVQGATISKISLRGGSSQYNENGKTYAASTFFIHPNYNSKTRDYDVALIKTTTNFEADSVKIPIANVNPEPGTELIVTGWGKTSLFSSSLSKNLQGAYLTTKLALLCKLVRPFKFTKRMICASRSGSSTCTGDDGGPVVTVSSKQLVGVMSSSSVLCFPGLDNTFTSVASVNDWITKTIK